jgi:hypothetical protein
MTRTELIIQLLKVAIGIAFGAYFVWWSLQVLDRLTPEYDARTAVVARASVTPIVHPGKLSRTWLKTKIAVVL